MPIKNCTFKTDNPLHLTWRDTSIEVGPTDVSVSRKTSRINEDGDNEVSLTVTYADDKTNR